jgi:hypothetical protein
MLSSKEKKLLSLLLSAVFAETPRLLRSTRLSGRRATDQ